MIDSHCHFDFPDFDRDRQQIWERAKSNGINGILLPGTELEYFPRLRRVSLAFDNVFFALGLHPWFLTAECEVVLTQLRKEAEDELCNHRFIAIGETGLDFGISLSQAWQIYSFEAHLKLALDLSLPVIIHHHKSHNKIIELLKRYPAVEGVIHGFSGSEQTAQSYVDLGFKLGVGGTITFDRGQKTQRAVKHVGLSNLLLETDAPSMPVSGKQGQRNSPEYLCHIAIKLAQIFDVDVREVQAQTTQNFADTFQRASF